MADGRLRHAGFGEVVGEQLGLGRGESGDSSSSACGDPAVESRRAAAQQGAVGRVLHERVLEAVARLGRLAAADEEARLLELSQRRPQRRPRPARHGREQLVVERPADGGADLRHLLGRRASRSSRAISEVVQRRRDRQSAGSASWGGSVVAPRSGRRTR